MSPLTASTTICGPAYIRVSALLLEKHPGLGYSHRFAPLLLLTGLLLGDTFLGEKENLC